MPREVWRDNPEYLALWRASRASGSPDARFVVADWLEENDLPVQAWRERMTAITLKIPHFDPFESILRVGKVWMGAGDWARLLAAPVPDELLCVFDRDVMAYQYLRRYPGRCGWQVGCSDWSSPTERAHVQAVPRLEMLTCTLMPADDWDWMLHNLPQLTHLEANSPLIDATRLADLRRLTRLRGLWVISAAIADLSPLDVMPGLRHLHVGPYYYSARHLVHAAPGLESLYADFDELGDEILWPDLRSLQMARWSRMGPFLTPGDVRTLARHRKLEHLDVCCRDLTGAEVAALASMPGLGELALRVWDDVPPLKALANAKALESLTIEGAVNKERLAEIAAMTGLRSLTLQGVKADRQGLAGLAGLRGLETLKLVGECKDARPLTAVAELPNLEELDLKGLKASRRALEAVKAACPEWVNCVLPDEE